MASRRQRKQAEYQSPTKLGSGREIRCGCTLGKSSVRSHVTTKSQRTLCLHGDTYYSERSRIFGTLRNLSTRLVRTREVVVNFKQFGNRMTPPDVPGRWSTTCSRYREGGRYVVDDICHTAGLMAPWIGHQLHAAWFYLHFADCRARHSGASVNWRSQSRLTRVCPPVQIEL